MVLISGGVYCLMQWCRDTSEVCSVYTMLLQGQFVHTGSIMLRRLGEFAIIYYLLVRLAIIQTTYVAVPNRNRILFRRVFRAHHRV